MRHLAATLTGLLIGIGPLLAATDAGAQASAASGASLPGPPADDRELRVLYPFEETLFPPDFAPPAFRWQEAKPACDLWRITITFQDDLPPARGMLAAIRQQPQK